MRDRRVVIVALALLGACADPPAPRRPVDDVLEVAW
jgi:hypothetical protein